MHDLPRQKLSELLAKYGFGLCDDAKKLEAMLKDVLRNEHKRETFVLVSAVREGVPQELRGSTSGMPPAALAAKLVRQLCDNLGLDDGVARWSIETWAVALGVQIRDGQTQISDSPSPIPPTVTVPPKRPQLPPVQPMRATSTPATLPPNPGVDLAALARQHLTKAQQDQAKLAQAKAHAVQVQNEAKKLAETTGDFDAAVRMIELLDPQWRDVMLYEKICGDRDRAKVAHAQAHAAKVQDEANEFAERTGDFITAAQMIEQLEPQWRDAKLYKKICGDRDQAKQLDAVIHDAVQAGRLRFLRGRVQELLKLQPKRDDMRRLLDVLPDEPELAKEFTNSIGMRFVLIELGQFTMGSNEAHDEKPPHLVRITQPFYLGVFPVTQAEYQAVTGNNPSQAARNPRHPVERVSWDDAMGYAQKLSQMFAELSRGLNYRLPTEAEWEYACRAGSTGKWCCGDQESQLGDYAWYVGNSGNRTHPVGEKKPNAWGLHDMHGNVWEWCLDWYEAADYKPGPVDDPSGPASAWFRVFRGGGFSDAESYCRSAYRGCAPGLQDDGLGFRLTAVPEGS